MDPELTQLEKELAELQPAGLSDSFIEKIEQAIADDIEQQKEAKVVLFPHQGSDANFETKQAEEKKASSSWPWLKEWRAAAAVAFLGAATALVMTSPDSAVESSESVFNERPQQEASFPVASFFPADISNEYMPVSTDQNFLNVADDGIVECPNKKAHRCIRVEYQQKTSYENSKGYTVEVEKPFVDYYVVPVSTD